MKMERQTVIVQKRRGRPSVEAGIPSAYVYLTVPAPDYDAVAGIAKRGRESVQDVIRRSIKKFLAEIKTRQY
jgi:hypothetical protein